MIPYYLSEFRTLWLRGRPGGGKTSLSIHLAMLLVKERYATRIAANIPLFGFGDPIAELDDVMALREFEDTVLILDEAYYELDAGASPKKLKEWLGRIRHRNQYLIMPSVLELNKQTRVFSASRKYNFLKLGVPLWRYSWFVSAGETKEKGTWDWWYPQRIFKHYNHRPQVDQYEKGVYYVYGKK